MLYIASALTPTPIIDSVLVTGFSTAGSTSLIVAKPDRIEVWDTLSTGLTFMAELEVWGNIEALAKVEVTGARPHVLVLLSPPNARLLLLTYSSSPPSLIVTSTVLLFAPTPSLRLQEFTKTVIAQDLVALVSMWTGVLSCVEMEIEKDKDAKKRRASAVGIELEEDGKRLKFKDDWNINIREHNLISIAFVPSASAPIVMFLSQSPTNTLLLQARTLSTTAHGFTDMLHSIDVISPMYPPSQFLTAESDFNDIPFSCPSACRILPIPSDPSSHTKLMLLIGDEHCVLYSISQNSQTPRSPKASFTGPATSSTRASAIGRSPQTEMVGNVGKRRKSSISGKENDRWEMRPVWRVRQGFGTPVAATVLESHPTGASVLLSDESGRLTAIGWEFEKDQGILGSASGQLGSVHVRKLNMGVASPASSLTYIDGSHLFLSSICGDSLLIHLSLPPSSPKRARPISPLSPSSSSSAHSLPGRKGKGRARGAEEESDWNVIIEDEEVKGSVEVKERWMNLAPVKDFCVVVEEGGGVSHLVVASGAANTNSLRLVRSGVGLEEILHVEGIEGIERIWPLSSNDGCQSTSSLLLSTASSSILLHLQGDITQAEVADVIGSKPTLAAGLHRKGNILIQVTSNGVHLWSDVAAGTSVAAWSAEDGKEIVAATIIDSLVVVAQRGGIVVVLSTLQAGLDPIVRCMIPSEISSLAALSNPVLSSPVLAVATWTNEILLYTLEHLQSGNESVSTISEKYFAQSLILRPSSTSSSPTSGMQLLAGLSDGTLITYDLEFSDNGGGVEVKSRKASSLGTRPLTLCPIAASSDGNEGKILSIGLSERMSVIFEARDRIDFSSVSKKDVTAATAISSPSLGQCLVLATARGLSFAKVNSLKKLHVQTLDLGVRSASHLASIAEYGILGVGVTSRSMDSRTGEILQSGFFELRDASTLRPLAEISLHQREEVTSVKAVLLLGRSYFAVGTAIFPSDDEVDESPYGSETLDAAREGRVLLVEARNEVGAGMCEGFWRCEIMDSVFTVGPVHDTEVIHGFLAVAAASKVTIYNLEPDPFSLKEVSSWALAFIASRLRVTPQTKIFPQDRLVVGDGIRSIFVLEVNEENGDIMGDQRDMVTHSVTALEGIRDGGQGVIIADGSKNLLTFRLNEDIETAARFGLHEQVARFRPGSLAPPSSAPETINPDILFATCEGRLGMIGELSLNAARTLDGLQRNMDRYYKGPGGIGWKAYRRAGNELNKKDTAGFIDGDFVQKFITREEISVGEVEKILAGSNPHENVPWVNSSGEIEPAEKGDVSRILETAAGLH